MAQSPTSSGPLDPNHGGETGDGLQVLLPLNTHRFFQRGFGVREVPSHTGTERGGLNPVAE
jgi:hypothetical protein